MSLDPLLWPICIPLVLGLFGLWLPASWERARAWLTILASAATLLAVWQVDSDGDRALALGNWMRFRVDALSRLTLLATAVFALLIAVYSLGYLKGRPGQRTYSACLLWSLGLSCGVLLADDLLVLLVCWGLLALTLYLMIGLSGPGASAAARKTFMVVGGSDALLLLGTALIWVEQGATHMNAGILSLDSPTGRVAFVCLVVAVFAKVGAIPLHSWLPDAGEAAHAPVTAYLPASLDKLLGIYLLVRVVTHLSSPDEGVNALLMCFGAVTILGGTLLALAQRNLKRSLAYCAVGQVGYILLGIGTGTALGLAAALFHMLNHAIYKSCLFLGAGVVENQAHTVDLDELGGLANRLPFTFAACLIASLSVSGVPPFNGFASKWMVYQAVIDSGLESRSPLWVLWLATAMLGSVLTLALFVKLLHAVFLCKPAPGVRAGRIQEGDWSVVVPLALLAGTCVVFGVFAQRVPLPWLILPAVGQPVELTGTWWAGQAAGLLLVTFLVGWTFYAFAMRNGKLRKCPTYIGGERMDETRLPGVPRGSQRFVEVTGVDFYRTLEQLPPLTYLYQLAQRQALDVYQVGGFVTALLTNSLRWAHAGLLPQYLAWFLLGLLAILLVMMKGIS